MRRPHDNPASRLLSRTRDRALVVTTAGMVASWIAVLVSLVVINPEIDRPLSIALSVFAVLLLGLLPTWLLARYYRAHGRSVATWCCRACKYHMHGHPVGMKCPECGHIWNADGF